MMFALFVAVALWARPVVTPVPAAPAQVAVLSDAEFDAIAVDPGAKTSVVMGWRDARGERYGALGDFERAVVADKRRLVFAMNGGMYDPDGKPVGLYVEDGRELVRLFRGASSGNFGWKPNGVFAIDEAGRGVITTTEAFDAKAHVRYATQSGPMLLIGGKIHPEFKAGSTHRKFRNGVGVTREGRVVLAISKVAIGFYEMAQWFDNHGCVDALYLDGSVSRALWRDQGLTDTGGDFGVIIGVVE